MATYTSYISLEKPLSVEKYDVAVANKNNDVIDSELHKLIIKNQRQDEILATKESLSNEITRATSKENELNSTLLSEITRAKSVENINANNLSNEIDRASLAEERINALLQEHIFNKINPHNVTKVQLELENIDNTSDMDKPVSTAQQNALDSALFNHNISELSHNDIRILISELTTRLNVLADSDDITLDQLSEIVAYIKNNKDLIDGITTSKVNVSDIIDDLTSADPEKPLSSKQGTVLKGLITDLVGIVDDKVDKISGKGLSTNDFTNEDKNKLSGVASGANANVQSDWNVIDPTSDAFIKNKPTSIPANGGIAETISGILPISKGGTGKITANEAFNALAAGVKIGMENEISSDDDYYLSQCISEGKDTNPEFLKRKMYTLWLYIKNKLHTVSTYGICSTASNIATKLVDCPDFKLVIGSEITVKFIATNTAVNPMLNVNNTGEKSIYYHGSPIPADYLVENSTCIFRYNGTQWDLVGNIGINTSSEHNNQIVYSDTQPDTLTKGMTWIEISSDLPGET